MNNKGVEYAWWQIVIFIIMLALLLWYIFFATGLRESIISLLQKIFGFAP